MGCWLLGLWQALDRLNLQLCSREADQAWPSGMSVRWQGPMDPTGLCTVLLMRDGTDVPAFWQDDAPGPWQSSETEEGSA
jgi:hypothetical protein